MTEPEFSCFYCEQNGRVSPLTQRNMKNTDKPPVIQTERLLTRKEVAQRWGVVVHTIARNKNLKAIRFNGRLLRYRIEDVIALEN